MKPLIMLTNDDGINSPGLLAAIEAVYDLGDIIVSAPHVQQTGMSRAFPRGKDVGIIDTVEFNVNGKIIKGYGVHGSPAFSVAHGILEIADRKPDLCISGINYGENVGLDITCSGTVGAVIEADSHGVAGIAVSMQSDLSLQRSSEYSKLDWTVSKSVLRTFAKKVLSEGMPKEFNIYNINIPMNPTNPEVFRYTVQSKYNYFEFIKPQERDFEMPFELKSRLYVDKEIIEKNSDIYAVYIDKTTSVTPIKTNMSVLTNETENYIVGTVSI